MPLRVVIIDLFALLAALVGSHLAFRQEHVRRWWRRLIPRDPAAPPRPRRPGHDDPARYAMMIAGVMVMAFGLILGAFTTAFALMSASLAP